MATVIKIVYNVTNPIIKVTYDVTNVTIGGQEIAPVYINMDYSSSSAVTVITSVGLTMPTGFSVANSPLTSSGTLNVTFSGGYSLPTTTKQSEWDQAYNDKINSASVTGTTTKTLTLNQQDGGTIQASWTDDNTDAVTSVFGRTGAVIAVSGDYTTTLVTEGTNLYYTEGRVSANTDVAANTAARHNAVTIGTANGLSLSTQALSLALASGSTTGALSSTDWNTFNGKQGSGNYITALTGEVTASGPGSASATLLNSAVIGKVLTGLNLVGGGTISATDTILEAFGKTQNQISALVGGVMYEGVWNASTNSPSISSGVGSKGDYYVVSVAGSTNIDGISDWKIGDWIIFNGTTWDKVDNTDAVSSVNGFTGAVSLTTANISEVTNLYFTDTRARNAITLTTTGTTGASTYSGGTLNIPIYSLSGLGGVPTTRTITINGTAFDLSADRTYNVGTVTSVDISVPTGLSVSGNPITTSGTLAISLASGYVIPTQTTLDGKVPYTGATTNVNLGTHTLTANDLVINHPSGSGAAASISKGGNGEALTVVKGSGSGNAASITGGVTLLDELHLTTDLADAYIASAATWNAKQNALNGTGFVKISGTTISYDNSTYYLASNPNAYIPLTALSAGAGISYNNTTGVIASTITQYTNADARLAISESVTGLDYDNTTGVFSLTSGYVIPTTTSATNWDAAYNDKINSAAVTGTTTKTLTLNQQDGGTITASWTDINTDAVTSVFGRTGAVIATSGDYTTAQVTESGNLYYTDTRARAAITLTTTGSSGSATYSGGTLNIPTYSVAGLGAVPDSRTITINGVVFDLSANRNFEIGDYGTF
jgi:hypothetical protein